MKIIDIVKETKKLKKYISQFETISFVTQYYYALNTHTRTTSKVLSVESPLRQITFLISLFLDTNSKGPKVFDLVSGKGKMIEAMLTKIENGYRYNYLESIKSADLDSQTYQDHMMVAQQTFLNYFVNGELNYPEQEIDRIERTFRKFDDYIFEKTTLRIDDYLEFYSAIEYADRYKLENYYQEIYTQETHSIYREFASANGVKDSAKFNKLFNVVEKALYKLPINRSPLNQLLSEDKVNSFMDIFSCSRKEKQTLRFYTDDCTLNDKPIVILNREFFIVPCQKQLIHSIYTFLFTICKDYDKDARTIHKKRDAVLEEKTKSIFTDYFKGEAAIYHSYYIDKDEKDLLVLYKDLALIIECKAGNYREPLRNPEIAFNRIRNDFQKTIQYAYDQTEDVYTLFKQSKPFDIKDKKRNVIRTIYPSDFKHCFSIVVTNERFGQIQCDLGLLLKLSTNNTYPWSVYVNDLETFLLTLKRKEDRLEELIDYLTCRHKLHTRLWCFDELELCGSFIMEKGQFIVNCNRIDEYYLSSPDLNRLFDDLYQTGLGFENERHLDRKITRTDKMIIPISFNLKESENITSFKNKIQK